VCSFLWELNFKTEPEKMLKGVAIIVKSLFEDKSDLFSQNKAILSNPILRQFFVQLARVSRIC